MRMQWLVNFSGDILQYGLLPVHVIWNVFPYPEREKYGIKHMKYLISFFFSIYGP